jgi:hypothetical protein
VGRDRGAWQLCERSGWPDNQSCLSVLAWCWSKAGERFLVVIHFGDGGAQARIRLPWDDLSGKTWRLDDALSDEAYDRSGDELRDTGLYVDLGPWKSQVFRITAV